MVVRAFRKRLKHRGYIDIEITRVPDEDGEEGNDMYLVKAREPLAAVQVEVEMDLLDMHHSIR